MVDSLAKRRNNVDERFPARPVGAPQMTQYGVAVLDKGTTLLFGLRLVLDHLGHSESINSTLTEH